jgi:hypothetical protein
MSTTTHSHPYYMSRGLRDPLIGNDSTGAMDPWDPSSRKFLPCCLLSVLLWLFHVVMVVLVESVVVVVAYTRGNCPHSFFLSSLALRSLLRLSSWKYLWLVYPTSSNIIYAQRRARTSVHSRGDSVKKVGLIACCFCCLTLSHGATIVVH